MADNEVPQEIIDASANVYIEANERLDGLIQGLIEHGNTKMPHEVRFATAVVDLAKDLRVDPLSLGPMVAAVYRLVRQREMA